MDHRAAVTYVSCDKVSQINSFMLGLGPMVCYGTTKDQEQLL